jgi:monofunctional glycosyltransferase
MQVIPLTMADDPTKPYIGSLPNEPCTGTQPDPRPAPAPKKRRAWPWVVFATVIVLVMASWSPVMALRWRNPSATAFMLETALGTGRKVRQVWVPYDRIAAPMRLAVVASEDQTFPTNHGFDIEAIRKAIKHNEQGGTLHGASTITQQTAKNLFLWPGGGYFRKGIGAWFTVLIDLSWPKKRVLEMYLNIAQFGPHIFGVEAAAEHYFGKHASQLNRYEAALLAATLPDPDHFNPDRPSEYLLQRQQWILGQMQQLGSDYLANIDR